MRGGPDPGDPGPCHGLGLAAVVLAAGAGTRFSVAPGGKLLSELDGRPLLAHVLAALRAFGPDETLVVLGHRADAIEDAIEGSIGWAGETRVRNHAPERGLASSLRLGIDALRASSRPLRASSRPIDGAFVVLGDQPRLQVGVLRSLADAAAASPLPDRLFVVPRYGSRDLRGPDDGEPGAPRNPVLLMRSGWGFVDGLEGDQGLARMILARPDLVLEVPVPGDMPDVDEPADLEALRSRTGPSRSAADPR